MLSYALAIAVGLSSLILFSTAFLMSDIHRQDDFFWSAIGLFYALVLWFCGTSITGGLLLGQTAAVALLLSYNWQTLKLRKAIAHPERAEQLNQFSVLAALNGLFARSKSTQAKIDKSVEPTVISEKITIPETPSTDIQSEPAVKLETPETQEAVKDISTSSDGVAQKSGLFGKFFGDKKSSKTKKSNTSSITNTKLDRLLDEEPQTEAQPPQPSSTTSPIVVPIPPTIETPPEEDTGAEEVTSAPLDVRVAPVTEAESTAPITPTPPEVTPVTEVEPTDTIAQNPLEVSPVTEIEPADTIAQNSPEAATVSETEPTDTMAQNPPEVNPVIEAELADTTTDATDEQAIASSSESRENSEISEIITIEPKETSKPENTTNSDEKLQDS
jgi:hypothetical protein